MVTVSKMPTSPSGLASVLAALILLVLPSVRADELRILDFFFDFNGAAAMTFPGSETNYYLLRRAHEVALLGTNSFAAGAVSGANTNLTVIERFRLLAETGFFIVEAIPLSEAAGRDSDGDGISDDYELTHPDILNPGNRADAANDPDGDFRTNLEEYRAGTNPRSADRDFNFVPWVSREIAVWVDDAPGFRNIESREIAVFVDQKPGFKEAISREISVLVPGE
jgi:hypothetical protein